MKKFLYIFLLLTFSFQKTSNKTDDEFSQLKKKRLDVLKKNKIGKTFEFDFTGKKGCNKTALTYLGIVTTNDKRKFKLLNCFFVTGNSCRGISSIVVYDSNNVYLGSYYVEMPYNLPDALVNNDIIYTKEKDDLKGRKGTKISFNNGLPQTFYLAFSNGDFHFGHE